MKNLIYLLFLLPSFLFAQNEANLLSSWDDPAIPGSNAYNNRYNEVWGVVANNTEFGVLGSTLGTHIIDLSDPNNLTEVAYLEGASAGPHIIHRDFKDYECYLYAVADEGVSSLQIIDISDLPNSIDVVYDSGDLITQAHNLYIDKENAILYAVATNSATEYFPLRTFSLADPTNPTPIGSWGTGIVGHVHDLYIEDQIGYLNCGGSGFYIVDFTDPANPVALGSLTNYEQQGYNHSGWLAEGGEYYYMGDETRDKDIKVVDVRDFNNLVVVDTIDSGSTNRPITHNQVVRGDYLYTSYYFDGLQVFDISNPASPQRMAYYDTYPGEVTGTPYVGAWGIYPLLPSGKILISDMQTGLYLFDKLDATISGILPDLGTDGNCAKTVAIADFKATNFIKNSYPQPVSDALNLELSLEKGAKTTLQIVDMTGKILRANNHSLPQGESNIQLNMEELPAGMYLLRVLGEDFELSQKVVKL